MANEWAKVETYRDKERRELIVFSPLDKGRKPTIRGTCVLLVKGVHPQLGVPVQKQQGFEFAFPDGTTLKKAMETFDKVAEKEIAKYEEEQKAKSREKKVVPARQMPSLLGADGKPIRPGG